MSTITDLLHKISRQQLQNKNRSNEVNPDNIERHKDIKCK